MDRLNLTLLLLLVLSLVCSKALDNDPEVEGEGQGYNEMPAPVIWAIIDFARNAFTNFDTTVVYHAGRNVIEMNFEAVPGYTVFLEVLHRGLDTCGVDGGHGTAIGERLLQQMTHALDDAVLTMQANSYTSMVISFGQVVIRYFGLNRSGGTRPPRSLDSSHEQTLNDAEDEARLPAGTYVPGYHVLCALGAGNTLYSGAVGSVSSQVDTGSQLVSPAGWFRMVMQHDGNLVLYEGDGTDKPRWASNTNGYPNPCRALLYYTGELVVYDSTDGTIIWRSHTGCGTDCVKQMVFTLRDDGVGILWNPSAGKAEFVTE